MNVAGPILLFTCVSELEFPVHTNEIENFVTFIGFPQQAHGMSPYILDNISN